MGTYIRGLILTVIVCNLVLILTPEFNGDGIKKYVKYICSLIVLIEVVSPVLNSCGDINSISGSVRAFFDTANADEHSLKDEVISGSVKESANKIMGYISERYDIPAKDISIAVITAENDKYIEITELHIYIYNCGLQDRERIRRELSELTEVKVFVFGREASEG